MPLGQAADELLEASDMLDAALRLRLLAFREGYRAAELAHANDYAMGYTDGVLGRKHAEHEGVKAVGQYMRRWNLRGQARSRSTFGRPHPDDFTGRGAA